MDFSRACSRFEEVKEDAPAKPSKRARESDAAEEKPESASAKKNKKQKAESGKAVPAPAEETPKAEKADKKKKEKKADAEEKEKKADGKLGPKKTIAGGVVIQDAKVGTGPMAKKGNTVRMRYVGKLTNGKVFDKNTSGKPVGILFEL